MNRLQCRKLSSFVATALCGLLAACSSVASKVETSTDPVDDGVIYYMPMRAIKITVSVDNSGKETPAVEAGDTVPDLSRRFVLDYERNWVGKNHLVVGVSSSGLLTSSNADTVSGVITIAKNLSQAAGDLTAAAAAAPAHALVVQPPPAPPPACKQGQSYVELVWPGSGSPYPLCNFHITVTLLGPSPVKQNDTPRIRAFGVSQSGLFYKHDLPYLVTLEDSSAGRSQFIAMSPSESEVDFVPVTRTFFANNTGNITLANGIVTSVDQSSDGELVAASELPADIISAYFSAIGSLFSQFSTNSANQTTNISNAQALSVAKIKQQACAAAIAANPIAGKTPDEAQAAITTIKNACS